MPKHPQPPPPIPIPGTLSNGLGGGNTPYGGDLHDDATPPSFPSFSPSTLSAMNAFTVHTPPAPRRRPSLPLIGFSETPSATPAGNRRSVMIPIRNGSVVPGLNGEGRSHHSDVGDRPNGIPKAINPREDLIKKTFKPLEDYLTTAFTSCDCLNASFVKRRSGGDNNPPLHQIPNPKTQASRAPWGADEGRPKDVVIPVTDKIGEKEAILLQRGRYMGKDKLFSTSEKERPRAKSESKFSVRSPGIDWERVDEFYDMVINVDLGFVSGKESTSEYNDIEEVRAHIARILLKATESLLKRPGRPLKRPEDVRFLLIVLANPLLYPESARPTPKLVAHGMSSSNINTLRPSMGGLVVPVTQLKKDKHPLRQTAVAVPLVVLVVIQES